MRKPEERVCPHCHETFLAPAKVSKYCSQRCSNIAIARRGKDNHQYNGGLTVSSDGRTMVVCRRGTEQGTSSMLYSRALMCGEMGRLLTPKEVVHHINGDRFDDRVENLQVLSRTEHIAVHRAEMLAARAAMYAARTAA